MRPEPRLRVIYALKIFGTNAPLAASQCPQIYLRQPRETVTLTY